VPLLLAYPERHPPRALAEVPLERFRDAAREGPEPPLPLQEVRSIRQVPLQIELRRVLPGLRIGYEVRVGISHVDHDRRCVVDVDVDVASGRVIGEQTGEERLHALYRPGEVGRHHLHPAGVEGFLRRE
jgi:hypothetical protein